MKVKVMSLHEVLSELLGVQPAGDAEGLNRDVNRKIQQHMANIERYKRDVGAAIGRSTQEVLKVLNTDHCDHPGHHMVPKSVDDMAAVYNVLTHIHTLFHHSYAVALRETVECAERMIQHQEDVPPNPSADALQAVLKHALSIMIATIAENPQDQSAPEIMRWFNQRLPETMARASEELMTGKASAQDDSAKVCRH